MRGMQAQLGSASGPIGSEPAFVVPGAFALMGTKGTGKSVLARRVCLDLVKDGALALEVACAKLSQPSRKFKTVQGFLQCIFAFASHYAPTVVLFEDLDALCPAVEQGATNLSITEERSQYLSELIADLSLSARGNGSSVAFLATMPEEGSVHKSLWQPQVFEHKISLRAPTPRERPTILQALVEQKGREGWDVAPDLLRGGALEDWAAKTEGFSIADLATLVDRALTEVQLEAGVQASSAPQSKGSGGGRWWEERRLAVRHLERAVEDFTPSNMQDQKFFDSGVQWSDVGGLDDVKTTLLDMLTLPTRYAALYDQAPVRCRQGAMLVGPPGCGKTMVVHALATETRGSLRFLAVKGPELLSKYIGASEAGVRQVFERAAAASPSVLFFDEIESLAPKRGGDSTGVTDRVVNQMLCYLDGVEDRGRVFVIAATSRPDLVDAALMRPGRFDKICYVGLPDANQKLKICEILAAKFGFSPDVKDPTTQQQLRQLVQQLPRLFTCADLHALFSSAQVEVVHETVRAQSPGGGIAAATNAKPTMTARHLFAALSTAKASISEADHGKHSRIFQQYMPGASTSAMRREARTTPAPVRVALG